MPHIVQRGSRFLVLLTDDEGETELDNCESRKEARASLNWLLANSEPEGDNTPEGPSYTASELADDWNTYDWN